MNTSGKCEALFNDANDLGSGIAAIGELLRYGQHEAHSGVLDGIGAVLHHLGKTMCQLNEAFLAESYLEIRQFEIKEEQIKEEQVSRNEDISTLRKLLDEAINA